jgi:predicted anti-sigma-YlaC factor YlaD
MHEPIRDGLEDYLGGALAGERLDAFDTHLNGCRDCRESVDRMKRLSQMTRSLRVPQPLAPPPAFYARVMQKVEAQRRVASFWAAFLEPAFGRRLAYASLTLLLLLGGFLYTTEPAVEGIPDSPEVILANEDRPPAYVDDSRRDRERDTVLVTLTTYQD